MSLVVRLVVSALMLAVLVAKVPSFDLGEMVPSWSVGTAAWLAAAALLTLAGIVLSALRLIEFPFGTILGAYGLWVLFNKDTEALFPQ